MIVMVVVSDASEMKSGENVFRHRCCAMPQSAWYVIVTGIRIKRTECGYDQNLPMVDQL